MVMEMLMIETLLVMGGMIGNGGEIEGEYKKNEVVKQDRNGVYF